MCVKYTSLNLCRFVQLKFNRIKELQSKRMHSSRMHTARLLTVVPVCRGGRVGRWLISDPRGVG